MLNEEQLAELAENIIKFNAEGRSLKSLVEGKEQVWETIYFQAHRLYKYNRFADAEGLFLLLTMVDPDDERYGLALGLARQKQQKHDEALEAYTDAAVHGSSDPWVSLHSAECYLKVEQYEFARGCLDITDTWAEGHADAANIEQRVKGLRKVLEKRDEKAPV